MDQWVAWVHVLNSLSQLVKFQRIVEQDIKTELEKDFDNRQRMLPTHVIKLPDGTEVGDYIVLDFGGKFFRIHVHLLPIEYLYALGCP